MTVYQHFRQEERPFIDSVLDWKEAVLSRFTPKCTDFLDPRQREIVKLLIGENDDVQVTFYGGYNNAERKKAMIMPRYAEVTEDDFNISLFELHYPKKFTSITHPNLLGTLMGLGLVRDKFGDLLFGNERVQFLATSEIADYVRMNLTSVGRVPITCDIIELKNRLHNTEEWEDVSGTVTSLRLDTILSEIYRLSRSKAVSFIEHGSVKSNWKPARKASDDVRVGDYLSVRGLGRSRIEAIEGVTKKGHYRIRFGKLK